MFCSFNNSTDVERTVGNILKKIIQRDMGFYITTLVLVCVQSKAPIHGTDILRPHPTEEARKIVSCFRTFRIQHIGLYSNPVPRVLKSAPLPLSYRGSRAKTKLKRYTYNNLLEDGVTDNNYLKMKLNTV